jgi:5-methylcytosine-specific restriction endonuclease McrA
MSTRCEEFTGKTKAQAFQRAAGKCEGCGARLYVGKYHYDHGRAAALLGKATLENCRVLCVACHGEKTTTEDVPRIAAAKRQERKHIGARKPATMPGSRNSRWKKKLDGTVERRS